MAEMTNGADARVAKALENIRALEKQMAQRSSFRVKFEDFHVLAMSEIRDWQEIVREESGDARYTLPPELIALYRQTGGFNFRWTCETNSGVIEGAIVLASLPELFQRDDEQDKPMSQCMSSWRRFDDISPDAYTAIRVDEPATKCVYFKAGQPIRINTTPGDYVIAAGDHMGIMGWQEGGTEEQEKIVRELATWD